MKVQISCLQIVSNWN